MGTQALVGFAGSRNLGSEWGVLTDKVVEALRDFGRGVAVGCAVGADARVLQSCVGKGRGLTFPRLEIFAVFGQDGSGDWGKSATKLVQEIARFPEATHPTDDGCHITVHWWAGGGSEVHLVQRLKNRTKAMVEAVAASGEGRGLIAFVTGGLDKSPGTWSAIRMANERGVPVIVFPCGCSEKRFPALGKGQWVRAGKGIWMTGWKWVPDDGAQHTANDTNTAAFVKHAKNVQQQPPSAPQEDDCDLLDIQPRPAIKRKQEPSLLSILTFGQAGKGSRGPYSPLARKLGQPSALWMLVVLLIFDALVLFTCKPYWAKQQPSVTLQAYHDHVSAEMQTLAGSGCIKATEYCKGQLFVMPKFPGGGELTVESYQQYLASQMTRYTDGWCFIPSDKCLEAAYQAVEPPKTGGAQ